MSRQALLGILCLLALVVAGLTLPHGAPSTTTDPQRIATMTEEMLPGAKVPVGFAGTLGLANRLVLLAPPGQNVTLLALGTDLEKHVGGTPETSETVQVTIGKRAHPAQKQTLPGILRYVTLYRGVSILIQGPPNDFPQKAWETFLNGLSAE